ncbi:arrestin domain-containing protein 17-like [Neocloeon triangulifer]|uniref:arrestin domain-containing protein 17-like n=1 Tax=Neocloeon triangulifer TaxID=2078957 RepID=UPI00286F6AA9|nr:arrestin domain-containing protein 17-like [Neocloeon triangulifer]
MRKVDVLLGQEDEFPKEMHPKVRTPDKQPETESPEEMESSSGNKKAKAKSPEEMHPTNGTPDKKAETESPEEVDILNCSAEEPANSSTAVTASLPDTQHSLDQEEQAGQAQGHPAAFQTKTPMPLELSVIATMGLEEFKILFDNPMAAYFAGQTVSGRIVIRNEKPEKYRAIILKLAGEAKCTWSQAAGQNSTVQYIGDETCFDQTIILAGGINTSVDAETLAPGEHEYTFRLDLPPEIPSSYEGVIGAVRYYVSVVVERPWKFDHVNIAFFTVIALVDLNSDPLLTAPVNQPATKTFSCGSGAASIVLSLPTSGAVPGEIIVPTLKVENDSRADLNRIKLRLVQFVTYKVKDQMRIFTKTVVKASLDSVKSGQSTTFNQYGLKIPPVAPSTLNKCQVIQLTYYIIASFSPSAFFRRKFHVQAPLVVGTVPLRRNVFALGPSAPDANQAPPSYEECAFGGPNVVKKALLGENFKPKYPVYHG